MKGCIPEERLGVLDAAACFENIRLKDEPHRPVGVDAAREFLLERRGEVVGIDNEILHAQRCKVIGARR